MAYTVNPLTGRACLWGTAEWMRGTPACYSFPGFSDELRKGFGTGPLGADAGRKLVDLGIKVSRVEGKGERKWNNLTIRRTLLEGMKNILLPH